MTNEPRDHQADADLGNDLEKVRSAWTRLERTEPPDLLDQAVLNAARRELSARPKRRPMRWLGAFATATVVVLALSIVIQQNRPLSEPVSQGGDDFRLEQAAPKKEAVLERAAGQIPEEIDEGKASELQLNEPAAAPAAAPSPIDGDARQRFGRAEGEEQLTESSPDAEIAVASVAEEVRDDVSKKDKGRRDVPAAEDWIERLLLLRETQQDEKLIEELAAFREAYPDYPLPPGLED